MSAPISKVRILLAKYKLDALEYVKTGSRALMDETLLELIEELDRLIATRELT